jgi:hypothetical protein
MICYPLLTQNLHCSFWSVNMFRERLRALKQSDALPGVQVLRSMLKGTTTRINKEGNVVNCTYSNLVSGSGVKWLREFYLTCMKATCANYDPDAIAQALAQHQHKRKSTYEDVEAAEDVPEQEVRVNQFGASKTKHVYLH